MAMESEAEALGQLATSELDGKVLSCFSFSYYACEFLGSSVLHYLLSLVLMQSSGL